MEWQDPACLVLVFGTLCFVLCSWYLVLGGDAQRTKNKEQRTKNKEQRTKNKEQRTKNKELSTNLFRYLSEAVTKRIDDEFQAIGDFEL